MHETSIIQNLIVLLRNVCEKENAIRVVSVEMTVNVYSCLDEGNLNFIFSAMTEKEPWLKDARIRIKRSEKIQDREYVVDNVEIEVK